MVYCARRWTLLIVGLCTSSISARHRSLLVANLSALNHSISLLFVCNVASTSPISLLSVTQSLYSLAITLLGRQWWLRFGPILGFVVLSSNLWWWMLLFFWILWWICGSPLVTDFGFCGCCCFLGLWIYGSPLVFLHLLVFFFFFLVVVSRMDMGLLGWDGRVWVYWIDRWV